MVHKVTRRLIGLFSHFGYFTVHKVHYEGQGVSSNDFYAGGAGKMGWKVRAGIKAKYGKIFTYLIKQAKLPWFERYAIVIFYNSRHDPSNVGGMVKLFEDALKQEREGGKVVKKGAVYDDSKQYCKLVAQIPDPTMRLNNFEFVLLKLK